MKNMTVKTDKRVTYQKVAEISKTPGRNVILEKKVAQYRLFRTEVYTNGITVVQLAFNILK